MILRPADGGRLLITQPDHAALAARMMQHWRVGGLVDSPRRDAILLAIQQHDNGWEEVDAAPSVDRTTGRILDFINITDDTKREIWPRGVKHLAKTPYAAALIAQHALHIYRRYQSDPHWERFFETMADLCERHLRAAAGPSRDDLMSDYSFVRIGDLASLAFCNAWTEVQTEVPGYRIGLAGERLVITPDPFEGQEIPFEIRARFLPDRSYTASDAAEAFWHQTPVTVRGTASGR